MTEKTLTEKLVFHKMEKWFSLEELDSSQYLVVFLRLQRSPSQIRQ